MGTIPDVQDYATDNRTKAGGRLDLIEQRLAKLETARDFVFVPIRALINTNLPTTWAGADTISQDLVVPKGYSQAIVSLTAVAGASFTGTSGNAVVGAWPGIAGSYISDDAISTGLPGQGSQSAVNSIAALVSNLGTTLHVAARGYANVGGSLSVTPGSGNVHIAGFAIFLR